MQEIIKKTIIARLAFDNTLYNIKNWAYLCRYKSLTTFHVLSSYHPYAVFLPPSSWSEVVTVSFVFLINPFYIYYFSINKTTFYFSLMVSDSLYQRSHHLCRYKYCNNMRYIHYVMLLDIYARQ